MPHNIDHYILNHKIIADSLLILKKKYNDTNTC